MFDGTETDALRTRYGRNTLGILPDGPPLVEKGVRFVTINYGGWDTHKEHFEAMRTMLPQLDKGVSTLLEDLADRGLLESTIVWCSGEFGRTPQVQWEAPWNGGRNHFGAAFSTLVAGGGFRGGAVVGASDSRASEVADRPVYPWDMIGAMTSCWHRSRGGDCASTGHGCRLAAQGERRGRSGWATERRSCEPAREDSMRRQRLPGLTASALLWLAGAVALPLPSAQAQNEPHLGYIYPAGGQAGTAVRVTVGGQYLTDTAQVLVTGEGIQATIGKHKKPLNEGQASQVRVKIDLVRDKFKAAGKEFNLRTRSGAYAEALTSLQELGVTEETLTLLDEFEQQQNDVKRQLNPAIEETIILDLKIEPPRLPDGAKSDSDGGRRLHPIAFHVECIRSSGQEPNDAQAGESVPPVAPRRLTARSCRGDVDRFRFRQEGGEAGPGRPGPAAGPYLADAVPAGSRRRSRSTMRTGAKWPLPMTIVFIRIRFSSTACLRMAPTNSRSGTRSIVVARTSCTGSRRASYRF